MSGVRVPPAPEPGASDLEHHRVAIIGAGFAGIGIAATLKRAGYEDLVLLERAGTVGGTWRDNTYPGCQCDVPSHLYSFSFAPKGDWTRSFGLQPEIWDYLEDCADRLDVRRHVRFHETLQEASWDAARQRWRIRTTSSELTADFLIFAVGALSEPNLPDLPGIDSFDGPVFHSAEWRHDVDLSNKRVAVVGTGASAIQLVPAIQPKVAHLTVFQRTPPWVVPRRDRPIGPRERAMFTRLPFLQTLWRLGIYWGRELMVFGFVNRPSLMSIIQRLGRKHLEQQIHDPELRSKLTPDYAIGCKRILPSNEWYPAVQQPNVEVVTDGIASIGPRFVRTATGREIPADVIVLSTGFRVTTHPAFDLLRGADGQRLGDLWRNEGMMAYKGTTVAGFPNLFVLVGPNTGLGHSSMIFMMESQFAYVRDALRTVDERGAATIDVRRDAQDAYNADLQRKIAGTVWNTGGCASWYLDARGFNRTLWPGFTWRFRAMTRTFDAAAYVMARRRSAAKPAVAGSGPRG